MGDGKINLPLVTSEDTNIATVLPAGAVSYQSVMRSPPAIVDNIKNGATLG